MAAEGHRDDRPLRRLPGTAIPGRRHFRRPPHRARVRERESGAATGDHQGTPSLEPRGIPEDRRSCALGSSSVRVGNTISLVRKGTSMSVKPLSDETRKLLSQISTATLTSQLMARGLRNTFMQNVHRLTSGSPAMVGEAFTLRYIPSREDIDVSAVFESREHPQRKAVETIPPGHVLVLDCRQDKREAADGSILITRMMVRGAAGVVTDGGLRDSPTIAKLDIPDRKSVV